MKSASPCISSINGRDDKIIQSPFLLSFRPLQVWLDIAGVTGSCGDCGVSSSSPQTSLSYLILSQLTPPYFCSSYLKERLHPQAANGCLEFWVSFHLQTQTLIGILRSFICFDNGTLTKYVRVCERAHTMLTARRLLAALVEAFIRVPADQLVGRVVVH